MQIELKEITKKYHESDQQVLRNITLTVKSGDSIAITGPSGSGKSTLLNIAASLDKPTSGLVLYDSNNLSLKGEKELAEIRNKRIGFIFQMHHLLPQFSVIENVLLPAMANTATSFSKDLRSRALELLSRVGLSEKVNHFPGRMSVGECQRTAVVRAMINQPEVIFADEPTGSLDQESAVLLADLLFELRSELGTTLIAVTHSDDLAKRAGKVYRLINGVLQLC